MNDEELRNRLIRIMGTFDLATGHAETWSDLLDSLEQELRDILGYYRNRPSKQLNDSAFYMSDEQHIKNLQSSLKEKLERIAELENRERFIQNFAEEQHKRACDLENKPSKQLSDEEIDMFAYAFELWLLNNTDKTLDGIKDFARAIIKEITE